MLAIGAKDEGDNNDAIAGEGEKWFCDHFAKLKNNDAKSRC